MEYILLLVYTKLAYDAHVVLHACPELYNLFYASGTLIKYHVVDALFKKKKINNLNDGKI